MGREVISAKRELRGKEARLFRGKEKPALKR
jgi:hypothetical protein